jgi:hypothetical protein
MNLNYFKPVKMKKSSILFILFCLFLVPVAMAQPGGNERPNKQTIPELKIAFISKELNLTPELAQRFWPVYNEMEDKIKVEKKKQRRITKDLKENNDSYSETEFQKKSLEYMEGGIRESQLRKDYHIKIAGVIGYKKATKLLSLEQRFKRELLNRMNQGKPQGGRNGRPGGPRSEN